MLMNLAMLSLLTIAGIAIVQRAKRFSDGADDQRQRRESLAGLCQSRYLTNDERRAVKVLVEPYL